MSIFNEDNFDRAPINLQSISDKTIQVIANALKLDLTKVQPEEFRIGIVEELDKMAVYTTSALNNDKLAQAAMNAWDNLQDYPNFYTAPPNQDFAHVLTGKQIPGDTDYARVMSGKGYGNYVQYEHLDRYIQELVKEDFASVVASLKSAPAQAWEAMKKKLNVATQTLTKALNAAVNKIEKSKAKLNPWIQTFQATQQQTGEKLPIDDTLKLAQSLANLSNAAINEINQERQKISNLPQVKGGTQTPAQEGFVREITDIISEGNATHKKEFLNEVLTPTVVFGFLLAIVGGTPMLLKALYKLAKKLQLTNTAKALNHAYHVAHKIEEKVVDYAIPDKLSYGLYINLWKKGFKVRGSGATKKPFTYEEYSAGTGNARHQVEGLVYKMLLTYFFVHGGIGAIKAGISMMGVAEGAATSVKAVELAGAVGEVAELAAPVLAAAEGDFV